MSLFTSSSSTTYAVLIDVGSGSILISIIESKENHPTPKIIWSHREFASLKQPPLDLPAKHIMSTLLNAVLLIDGKGFGILRAYNPKATIDHVQVTYTAPFAYTVTKTMNFAQPEPFTVTKDLLEDLITTITKKLNEERVDREVANHRGLTIVNQTLSHMQVNGYQCEQPIGKQASQLTLAHLSDIVETVIVDAITDLQNKVAPRAETSHHSFMHVYMETMHATSHLPGDYCLITISHEATEVGIVREGILEYVTHVPVGLNTLVRGYANALNIPHEEAYSFLREPYHTEALEGLSETKKNAVNAVTEAYKKDIASLFAEKTDILSVPKAMYVFDPQDSDSFLMITIADAAKTITGTSHTVTSALDQLAIPVEERNQHAPSITARFFHIDHNHT